MSVARHHAEWLRLVESSGPFLSLPVLLRVFPQGLDARDPAKAGRLREVYEDWLDRGARQPAVHHAWIRHVLTELLEYTAEFLVEGQAIPPGMEAVMANFGETLRPDFALKHRDAGMRPLLLIMQYAPDQDLEKPVTGKIWKASPGTRMMELLHAADVPLGLVTNGEAWMLVYAPPGETTGFASWYADLWMQEPITLLAFHSLLHLRRFLGVAESETLAALYAESSENQQDVTDQLGYQVRRAVEMLVQAFDRIDAESDRKLLAGVSEKELYDSALTVMMRLVFLFSAEERGLLLLGDPLYDQHYAVSTLSELLRERADQHGEEILERRHDAWCRLLATFRAVHGGVEHEAMRLPPYGGTLFDPDRYPFLEGRAAGTQWRTTPAKPLPINNRVVLHLLEALQVLRVRIPGGGPAEARRLSFRALDIEQIGHVYEGLLDHTAKRAGETILGLAGAKNKEPEIPISMLEQVAARGPGPLIEFLRDETGRSEKALKRLIEEPPLLDDHALLIASGQNPSLASRVKTFAALLRKDSFNQLVVIPEGSVYVTYGTDRRSSGTHYTPQSLTEPIVRHTLEPLVHTGPSEGLPQADWKLKTPREILALKVCDMAMGSGAFLVQTCRYLSERLVEAWENAEKANPGKVLATPEGDFSTGEPEERLIPLDSTERLAIARRYVADRCLYGVDINPMAVEMAKLSLWLITLQRDRPFTFLDHALKCGDSLLGVSSFKQIENFSLRPGHQQMTLATLNLFRYVEEAAAKRQALENMPSNDHAQIEAKTHLHAEAEAAIAKVKAIADVLIAFELRALDGRIYEEARDAEAEHLQWLLRQDGDTALKSCATDRPSALAAHAQAKLQGRRTFHWPLDFPEVFARGGFDAAIGNPPFIGGRRIRRTLGLDYLNWLTRCLIPDSSGNADLCAFFYRRVHSLLRQNGAAGLVATSTIAEGDTRTIGLDGVCHSGATLFRAVSNRKWPGSASLEVAIVWFTNGAWTGPFLLDETSVRGISSALREPGEVIGRPRPLLENAGKSFQGSIVLGSGFVISPEEAKRLIECRPRNAQVVFPYLRGEDFASRPDQSPTTWVINFFDWPLDRSGAAGDHGPVASDFPDCLDIVTRLVKPERTRRHPNGEFVLRKPLPQRWWHYSDKRPALYKRIKGMQRVLFHSFTGKYIAFAFVPVGCIFAGPHNVFALDADEDFAVLQSTLHDIWAWEHCSTMGASIRYANGDLFETFPFPLDKRSLETYGRDYHEQRRRIMISEAEGLTDTYNRFHHRDEDSAAIERLRVLHVEMDQAVAAAYGWSDLNLGHGFHDTKQGERYTLSEPARHTILDRLLTLNQQRHAQEVAAGLHDKKKPKGAAGKRGLRSKSLANSPGLFEGTEE